LQLENYAVAHPPSPLTMLDYAGTPFAL